MDTIRAILDRVFAPVTAFGRYLGLTAQEYLIYRSLCHFLGGVLIGLPGALLHVWWASLISGALMFGFIVAKEIAEDRVTQPRSKTFIDVASWCLGFLVPTLGRFHV